MNRTLKEAIRAVEALPEADQEEPAQKLHSGGAQEDRRAARPSRSEAPHEEFMAELRATYGG